MRSRGVRAFSLRVPLRGETRIDTLLFVGVVWLQYRGYRRKATMTLSFELIIGSRSHTRIGGDDSVEPKIPPWVLRVSWWYRGNLSQKAPNIGSIQWPRHRCSTDGNRFTVRFCLGCRHQVLYVADFPYTVNWHEPPFSVQ